MTLKPIRAEKTPDQEFILDRDNSVTHLQNVGLIAKPSETKLQTVAENRHFDFGKSPALKKDKSALKSVLDLYNKDLGTMGLPRDISNLRQDQNFLFQS